MKTAVTNHAVDRYRDRVDGAKGFDRESIRESIREIVADGFKAKVVRDHPTERDRRVIPFKSGESILFLSIGPNNTTFEADIAVISVLFEHELTEGRKGGFGTLEEVAPQLKNMRVEEKWPPLIVFVGEPDSIESYKFFSREELHAWAQRRKPEKIAVYEHVATHVGEMA
jgi:hypothetical protein